jgi:Ca2+-binding RTX toxin-like protein
VGNTYSDGTSFENTTNTEVVAILNLQAATYASDLFVDTRDGSTDGDDSIVSGTGNDTIFSGFGDDTVLGGAGNDSIMAGDGYDEIEGGTGNDRFVFSDGDSNLEVDTPDYGQDIIMDWNAGDLIEYKAADATSFDVSLDVGVGTYISNLNTGNGYSTQSYMLNTDDSGGFAAPEVVVRVTTNGSTAAFANADAARAATVVNINNANMLTNGTYVGGVNNDTILGGKNADSIRGGAGDDVLHGGGGADTVFGGNGADYIASSEYYYPGAGDRLYGDGDGTVKQQIIVTFGGDTTDNTSSLDHQLEFSAFGFTTEGFTVQIPAQDDSPGQVAALKTAIDNHVVLGKLVSTSVSSNTLTVTSLVDGAYSWNVNAINSSFIDGVVTSTSGSVSLDGADTIVGGTAGDFIWGGAGDDQLTGNLGDDTILGGDGNDTIEGGDADASYTSADWIDGGAGNDSIGGGSGNDTIFGGSGNDTIRGDDGDDLIYGGQGNDVLTGGFGADTFVFEATAALNGEDTIMDFVGGAAVVNENNGDRLDLSRFESAGGGVASVTGSITQAAGKVYFLGGQAAGAADSASAAASALNASAVWTATTAITSWIVISDNNSAAVYSWSNVAGSSDEVGASELTLVGTISGTVAIGDIIV